MIRFNSGFKLQIDSLMIDTSVKKELKNTKIMLKIDMS